MVAVKRECVWVILAQTSCGIAQAVTRHRPISKLKLKVEAQTRGGGRTQGTLKSKP